MTTSTSSLCYHLTDEFKFFQLDVDCLRAEMLLLIRHLTNMYVNDRVQISSPPDTGDGQPCVFDTTITMKDNFSWNGNSTITEKVPKTLDHSFPTNIFEVGDAIQYKFKVPSSTPEGSEPSLITDDVITTT